MNRREARWPAGIALCLAAWYGSESLRHRRERGEGYELHGAAVDVADPAFMRAAEALTGAPVSHGDDGELLINGDAIFPVFLDTIRGAERTINLMTYVYWRGEIADTVAATLAEKAREGVEVNVILDFVGSATMERRLIRHR